jgi:hypothetical protein
MVGVACNVAVGNGTLVSVAVGVMDLGDDVDCWMVGLVVELELVTGETVGWAEG